MDELQEVDQVEQTCIRLFSNDPKKLVIILRILSEEKAKLPNSPRWKALKSYCGNDTVNLLNFNENLLSLFQLFTTCVENLISKDNEFFGYDIVNRIIFHFESQSAPILHALAADESKHGSRENAPHWKMLRSLVNDAQVSVLKHFFLT